MKNHVSLPEWVAAYYDIYPKELYAISLINGGYYLYERKNADGRKHVYIGALKKDGIHYSKHSTNACRYSSNLPVPSFSSSESVYEYGFSKALIDLCPPGWKERWGKDAMPILYSFILCRSPCSYLCSMISIETRHYPGAAIRAFRDDLPVSVETIQQTLGNIWLIQTGNTSHLSMISSEQQEFCSFHNIHLLEG